jgi:hypothetical protein
VPETHKLGASVAKAYDDLINIRKAELARKQGFSTGRMTLTLTHKHGHSLGDATAAIAKYKADIARLKAEVNADLRDGQNGFGVTPVECSVLARLVDITAATKLMARQTPVSREAERGVKEITRLAMMQGYNVKTTQNRAFYTTDFVCDDHTLHMMGWHGTGRFAGGEKAILELYDSRKGEKPVVSIGVLNEDNVTPENEKRVIHQILDYIKKQG